MKLSRLLREAQFHGANRLVEPRHRGFWIVILSVMLWCSISVLTEAISRYIKNPTFTGRYVRYHHHMKFPMVSACPEIKFPKHKIDKFFELSILPPGANVTYLKSIIQQLSAFYAPDMKYKLEDLEVIEHFLRYNHIGVEFAGQILSNSCEETILRCSLQGEIIDCAKLFRFELTRYGYCCVFNGKSLRSISGPGVPVSPYSTQEVGPFRGLTLVLNQSHYMDDIDLSYKWLVVQDEEFFSDILFNGTALSRGWETWAMYSRLSLTVSEDARSLSKDLRKCSLSTEPLKYFPIYRGKHCLLECEIAQIIEKCGCLDVTFAPLPRVPICKAKDLPCIAAMTISDAGNNCTCPPACEEDIGSVNYVRFKLVNPRNFYVVDHIYRGIDYNKTSVVRVFAAEHRKVVYDRRSIFGLYDLYAQLGGIFSVFFGCSFLSLLELLRIFWYGFQYICKKPKIPQGNKVKRKPKKIFTQLETIPEIKENRLRKIKY